MATSMPVQYPIGVPAVTNATVSVDTMLTQPTRITRYLADISLQSLFANRIFSTPGGVTGGALIYDQLTVNDLYLLRDVQNVEPGAEFPQVTADRPTPKVALVEKFGGKFFITDEARDRNDQGALRIESGKLANNMTKGINNRAIAAVDASVTAIGAPVQLTGHNWSAVITAGTSATSASGFPAADFAAAQLLADTTELGVNLNLWIVNPAQMAALKVVYGSAFADVMNSYNISMIQSNRVAAGTAYVVEEGMVGEMRFEKPLSTETWRDNGRQRTWVQSDTRVVYAVTNPYSVVKVTGLAG